MGFEHSQATDRKSPSLFPPLTFLPTFFRFPEKTTEQQEQRKPLWLLLGY
jgi:hypothetical protein